MHVERGSHTPQLRLVAAAFPDPRSSDCCAAVQRAIGALWAACLAVLGTLKLQFARTTALALGIAGIVKLPVAKLLARPLQASLGRKLAHWGETFIDLAINLIAIIFAWYAQIIISAFYSGLRGGRLVADGVVALLVDSGCLNSVPTWMPQCLVPRPWDGSKTCLDEVVCYVLFVAGFSYQMLSVFSIPFPLKIVLLPLTIIEQLLRYQVTFTA